MNKKMFALGLAVFMILGFMNTSWASLTTYSGAWSQTDEKNFLTIGISSGGSDMSFYMYDIDEGTGEYLAIIDDGFLNYKNIYVHQTGEAWYASYIPTGTDLTLSTKYFGFYFQDSDSNQYTSYGLEGSGDVWTLTSPGTTSMQVLVSDAAPVPIPTAALLFGSAMLCLVGIRRVTRG